MIYYCYKTTNKISGRFFIGTRSTSLYSNSETDPALGQHSQCVELLQDIVKYGIDAFEKELLCYAEDNESNFRNWKAFMQQYVWSLKLDKASCYHVLGNKFVRLNSAKQKVKAKQESAKTSKNSKKKKGSTSTEKRRNAAWTQFRKRQAKKNKTA